MIFLRVLFFFLGICGLISFVAMFFEGLSASKLGWLFSSFFVMVTGFFMSWYFSPRGEEEFFSHNQMSHGRKFFLRLCFAVMGTMVMIVFIGRFFLERVTLTSLFVVASLLVTALFFFYCAISGRFPAYLVDSMRKKL